MVHSHVHHHEPGSYYQEQLLTIGICGLLAVVAVLMWCLGRLNYILHPFYELPVLLGGLGVLALVAIRGVIVWSDRRQRHACETHHHGEDCGQHHEPAESWIPVRYIVLLLPAVLFFLNLPNQTLAPSGGPSPPVDFAQVNRELSIETGEIIKLDFRELERAAYGQRIREFLNNKSGRLKGQFWPVGDRHFKLVRWKWTHCPADAIELGVWILCENQSPDLGRGDWVEVTGVIQFIPRRDKHGYAAILYVPKDGLIRTIQPEAIPYLQ